MLSYTAPRATVQQLLQKHDLPCNENTHVANVLQRIKTCRTAALGYHVYQCDNEECRHIKYQYHPSFIGTAETGTVPTAAP
jgi:exonuclease I